MPVADGREEEEGEEKHCVRARANEREDRPNLSSANGISWEKFAYAQDKHSRQEDLYQNRLARWQLSQEAVRFHFLRCQRSDQ